MRRDKKREAMADVLIYHDKSLLFRGLEPDPNGLGLKKSSKKWRGVCGEAQRVVSRRSDEYRILSDLIVAAQEFEGPLDQMLSRYDVTRRVYFNDQDKHTLILFVDRLREKTTPNVERLAL